MVELGFEPRQIWSLVFMKVGIISIETLSTSWQWPSTTLLFLCSVMRTERWVWSNAYVVLNMLDIIKCMLKDHLYDQIIFTWVCICVWFFGEVSFMVSEWKPLSDLYCFCWQSLTDSRQMWIDLHYQSIYSSIRAEAWDSWRDQDGRLSQHVTPGVG